MALTTPMNSTRPRRPSSRARNWAVAGVCAIALYFAPLFYLSANQRALIFAPTRYTPAKAAETPIPAGVSTIVLKTGDGETIYGMFGKALTRDGRPDSNARLCPTVLYLHGNEGDILEYVGDLEHFREMDANVCMIDYPGYGRSTGLPSEGGCYQAAEAAYDYLRSRPDLDPQRIVILGHSLGGAVAIDLAATEIHRSQPVAALAEFSSFTSIAEEGHHNYPLYPAWLLSMFVQYHFDSIRKIHQVTCPVLIVHSLSDERIPYAMSDRLAAASGGKVTRLTIDHIAHGYAFTTGAPQTFPTLRAFLAKSHT